MADTEPDVAGIEESLRQCRLELAALREEQETWAERIAPLEHAQRRLQEITAALDEHLSATEAATPGVKGWVKRRLVHTAVSPSEVDDLERIRRSPLFDGAWYLVQYPDVVASGLSPALHYLRHGAGQRRDPGPNFDARTYAKKQGLPRRANPLLHYQSNVPGIGQ